MTTDALPGLALDRLRHYLDEVRPGLLHGPLRGETLSGGRSNLTYVVGDGTVELVVRRPPLGHVLATAHDMSREYRVMTALAGSPVPVPRTVLLCEDPAIIGAPFYVMERVEGTVYRAEQTATLGPDRARALSLAVVDTLAALHSVDPGGVGLGDLGRPEGFLERQVRRWRQQLEASRSREIDGVDALAERLEARVPAPQATSILHGDYKLDNVMVSSGGEIVAVLDWEMATLGDPLADLGLFVVYWGGVRALGGACIDGVDPGLGFARADELVARYAGHTGFDLSNLDWYVAFGCFKLAVILEGIHYRFTRGQTVGEGFDRIGALVEPLVARGLTTLDEVSEMFPEQ